MAIQVSGTEVISNARALTNIASVDATTVATLNAAGVGAGGFEFTAKATVGTRMFSDGTKFLTYDESSNFYYSADGATWSTYQISGLSGSWYLRYFGGPINYWVIFQGRTMYYTSNPSAAGNWTYRALYGGYGGVQTVTMSWGYDRYNNYINPASPRIHAGHGWNGSYNSWGTSYSDNLGVSWGTGNPTSNGNHSRGYTYSPNLGRTHFGYEAFQWQTGSWSWNGSYPSFSQGAVTNLGGTDWGSWVKALNGSTDIYLYYGNTSNRWLVTLGTTQTGTTNLYKCPNSTEQVVWDATNSRYIAYAGNYIYTSTTGEIWAANFSPTGGALITSIAISANKLAVTGNNATFITDI